MGYLVILLAVVDVAAFVVAMLYVYDCERYAHFAVFRSWYVGYWSVTTELEALEKLTGEDQDWNKSITLSFQGNCICFLAYTVALFCVALITF